MPAKIRLQRHGRKRYAYYHIVIADSRAPRDGKNIERIGSYNPNTNPATIDLDFDKAIDWLAKGAQPTDTVRAILSYKGVMYKKHLLGGVAKGAFTAEVAETRFEAWLAEKANKVQAKKDGLITSSESSRTAQLEMETKKNTERANAIAKRNSDLADAVAAAAKAAAAPEVEEVVAEVTEESAPEVSEESAPQVTEG
ncbi:MAG TPA: 30S ribosomal protein S16 [Prolixibacteraceae bacterium]|nr:30S ribosomal protein S16 [Prolixibacteraceae bacterium]